MKPSITCNKNNLNKTINTININTRNSCSLSSTSPSPTSSEECPVSTVTGKMVIALHNYTPLDPRTDLRLEKGKEYTVISRCIDGSPGWWRVKNKSGQIGLIPSNYVQEASKDGVNPQTWFLPKLDREASEKLLKCDNREGSFVVRRSSTQDLYTISLLVKNGKNGEVKHYLIRVSANGKSFYIGENQMFNSIEELVNFHRHDRGSLATRLKHVPNLLTNNNNNSVNSTSEKQSDHHLRRKEMMTITSSSSSSPSPLSLSSSLRKKSWEIRASELCILEELGSGQFGVVRKGKWLNTIDVAVKMMKEGTMSEKAFIDEAKVMTWLQHPNLVQLYGLCIEHRPMCIVTEFMKHGSLLSYLRKNENTLKQRPLRLLDMCLQICSGMAYLEAHNYIHRDLAARNCLVGEGYVVKVADFGLTRYVNDDEYTSSSGTKFPIKWASPEVLWFTRFSSKSDVWAYGVLMWEVFTCGKMPYGRSTNAQVVEQIRDGKRLERPRLCPREVFTIMNNCWRELPENRPSFAHLQVQLTNLIQSLNLYP